MKKKLTNNMGMKLASLALAVVIWLVTQSIADPVTTRDFTAKVEIRNEDVLSQQDENYTYTVVSGDTARFTIRGKTSAIKNLTASDFSVYADMSKLSVVNAVPVEIVPKSYVSSSVSIQPQVNTLVVEIDELTTIQKDISVSISGQTDEGCTVGSTSCEPSLVSISGPKKILENADKLVVSVNVSGRSESFSDSVRPVLYDKNGDVISAENVKVQLDEPIKVNVQIWKTVAIDVRLDFSAVTAAQGYAIVGTAYSPKQILVTASDEALKESSIVTAGYYEYPISGETDLTETKEGVFLISDFLGENLRIMDADIRENGIMYQISVEKEVSASWPISFDKIRLIGANPDFTYRLTSGETSASLTVTGAEEVLNQARNGSSGNIQISIDVTNCDEPGQYSAVVSAVLPEGISLVPEQEIQITVEYADEAQKESNE